MEPVNSIRLLYRHFLSAIIQESLAAFYYACSYSKADYSGFMSVTVSLVLKLIPDPLKSQPVFFRIDGTMIFKFGRKLEDISRLFDYAAHNDSNYLNGRRFVSLMPCVPIWSNHRIAHLTIPFGYRMWQKKRPELELAASMMRQVTPSFASQKNVIVLRDSWYAKKGLACIVDKYPNLDLICNARTNSVIYDLVPQPAGRRGRPVEHGKHLFIKGDSTLSAEKIGDYYMGACRVLANIFDSPSEF